MVRVVTIGREFGSGGAEIAEQLATRLGWRLLDNALIEEIAQRAGVDRDFAEHCDERVDSALHRVLRSLWHGGYEGSLATTSVSEVSVFDADRMARLAESLILQAADLGRCVVVGRGGQCILQDREDALHFFIHAPRHQRIERVRRKFGPDLDAESIIIRKDRERENYIRRHFDRKWYDPHLYHAMLSSCLGEQAVVESIAGLIEKGGW